MAYIELQDFIKKLGEDELVMLTDNSGTGEIDEEVVNTAIEDAQGIFESHVRLRYTLPVPATAMARSINLKLAIFSLYEDRATIDEGVYKIRQNAKDDALKLLVAIGQGKASLDVPAVQETIESPATSDEVLTNAGRSKFTDSKLSGF